MIDKDLVHQKFLALVQQQTGDENLRLTNNETLIALCKCLIESVFRIDNEDVQIHNDYTGVMIEDDELNRGGIVVGVFGDNAYKDAFAEAIANFMAEWEATHGSK